MSDIKKTKNIEQISAAKESDKFGECKDNGYKKCQSQSFWLKLMEKVLGVDNHFRFITFKKKSSYVTELMKMYQKLVGD